MRQCALIRPKLGGKSTVCPQFAARAERPKEGVLLIEKRSCGFYRGLSPIVLIKKKDRKQCASQSARIRTIMLNGWGVSGGVVAGKRGG